MGPTGAFTVTGSVLGSLRLWFPIRKKMVNVLGHPMPHLLWTNLKRFHLVQFKCSSALPIRGSLTHTVAKLVIPGLGPEHLVAFASDGM